MRSAREGASFVIICEHAAKRYVETTRAHASATPRDIPWRTRPAKSLRGSSSGRIQPSPRDLGKRLESKKSIRKNSGVVHATTDRSLRPPVTAGQTDPRGARTPCLEAIARAACDASSSRRWRSRSWRTPLRDGLSTPAGGWRLDLARSSALRARGCRFARPSRRARRSPPMRMTSPLAPPPAPPRNPTGTTRCPRS